MFSRQLPLTPPRQPPPPPAPPPATHREPPPDVCQHPNAYPGLDACYCPDCGRSLLEGTRDYDLIMTRPR